VRGTLRSVAGARGKAGGALAPPRTTARARPDFYEVLPASAETPRATVPRKRRVCGANATRRWRPQVRKGVATGACMGLAGFVVLAGAGFQYYIGGVLYQQVRSLGLRWAATCHPSLR
jgi:hypothetical protein